MLIRPMSDLHLEFADFVITPTNEDKETVLVLAGDIGVVNHALFKTTVIPFLIRASEQFREVIVIMGNHEYYRHSLDKAFAEYRNAINKAKLDNVYLLNNQTRVVDDVAFVCSTLWTDCDSVYAPFDWKNMMDSRVIKVHADDYQKMTVGVSQRLHDDALQYINFACSEQRTKGNKIVVVTHHGVTAQSISPRFYGDALNCFFVSKLDNHIANWSADLIIHGHVHDAFDYTVNDTRVICNPRGYPHESSSFNQFLTIDV